MCFWKRSAALGGVWLALGVTAAYADSPQRNLQRSLPIAQAAWPTSQCRERERISITNAGVPLNADGVANMDGTCAVLIRPIKDPYNFCTTLVHELGHLAEAIATDGGITLPDGRATDANGHTDDGSVMDPPGAYYEACEAVGPPITARAAAASAFDLPTSACRFVANKGKRTRIYRCGVRRRVAVVLTATGDVDYVRGYR